MRTVSQTLRPERRTTRRTGFQIDVVLTRFSATRAMLGEAARLARRIPGARVRVIALRAVPYPLPLDNPPVSMRFDRERTLTFVDEHPTDATVLMCYCRDEVDALLQVLASTRRSSRCRSLVVIGGKQRHLFPTQAQRIASKLKEAGHAIVFVDSPTPA